MEMDRSQRSKFQGILALVLPIVKCLIGELPYLKNLNFGYPGLELTHVAESDRQLAIHQSIVL